MGKGRGGGGPTSQGPAPTLRQILGPLDVPRLFHDMRRPTQEHVSNMGVQDVEHPKSKSARHPPPPKTALSTPTQKVVNPDEPTEEVTNPTANIGGEKRAELIEELEWSVNMGKELGWTVLVEAAAFGAGAAPTLNSSSIFSFASTKTVHPK